MAPRRRDNPPNDRWLYGGCLAFAKALKPLLPGAKLVDVVEPQDKASFLLHPGLPHHVAVAWRGLYVDADGASGEDEFLSRWQDRAKAAHVSSKLRLEPHSAARAKEVGLRAMAEDVASASGVAGRIADGARAKANAVERERPRRANPPKPRRLVADDRVEELGEALLRALDDREAQALCFRMGRPWGARLVGWDSGGCWVLADAFARWWGMGAELDAVYDESVDGHEIVTHVAARVGDRYFDAGGAVEAAAFTKRWCRQQGSRIGELDEDLAAGDVPHDEKHVEIMLGVLKLHLGESASWSVRSRGRNGSVKRDNPGTATVLAPHEYPREDEYGTHDGAFVRAVAHDLKSGDASAVRVASVAMSPLVPKGAVLVPVPGSRGSTRENLRLAEAIARLAGARVEDGLAREPGESQHARRMRGHRPLTADEQSVRWVGGSLRDPVVLIDNVVTTGATARAAARAIGRDVIVLAWADASWRGRSETAEKRMNPAGRDDIKPRPQHQGAPAGLARPLLFHNVKIAMVGGDNSAWLEDLMRQGMSLMPSADLGMHPWRMPDHLRKKYPWLAQRGGFGAIASIDADAGDDRLVFFTGARPQGMANPVGYDLETVFAAGAVGWRGCDLMSAYTEARAAGVDVARVARAFTDWDVEAVRRAARLQSVCVYGETPAARLAALRSLKAFWRRRIWRSPAARAVASEVAAGGGMLEQRFMEPPLDAEEIEAGPGEARHESCEFVLRGSVRLDACLGWYDWRSRGWRAPVRG